ncbi:hypothetical protein AXK12_01740 [Cephaloticoccus capnophilus]|uniref:SAM-dependent MTase RsmB/NOP-type domain-containing protein n=1 Tax=Cephaloticoccus capnophilus TaxID=1548208 RepID=A0A139SS48_9BACT|nr:RsmB/NOP family class I SAM-dependent RNA methyltransferase [Cephaloticoccus capnophilus]KXU37425.1 hypothetical protein AXK12_01740 [Cephaloticoccus capnophilus]
MNPEENGRGGPACDRNAAPKEASGTAQPRAQNQAQIFLKLLAELRPHWRRDTALPERIQRLLASDRRFGSRDRRLYRELIYTTLRYLPLIEPLLDTEEEAGTAAAKRVAELAGDTPAVAAFREGLLGNANAAPAESPFKNPDKLYPDWFWDECPTAYAPEECAALHRRAPLWLRLQGNTEGELAHALHDTETEFAARGWTLEQSEILANALRAPTDADVTNTESFRRGLFEVQDLGSQLVLASQRIPAGGHWFDACAGAGGKTLQLAQILGPSGKVTAYDIRPEALVELRERAARARLTNIEIIDTLPSEGTYFDGVLVDAPCSGTGTWRRAPHLKWVTTHERVREHAKQQLELLKQFSNYVRPGTGSPNAKRGGKMTDEEFAKLGGRLVYATCSLCRSENEVVISGFQAECSDFLVQWASHTLMPAQHDTDGFFVCVSLRC